MLYKYQNSKFKEYRKTFNKVIIKFYFITKKIIKIEFFNLVN